MTHSRVTVDWTDADPVIAELTVKTNSFEILHRVGSTGCTSRKRL